MTTPTFTADLRRYGPDQSGPPPSLDAARAYCRQLARRHYENFTVASWLLPARLRPAMHSIYAYCRWADDLADEVDSAARSLRLLDWWADQLRGCYAGQTRHPVFVALRETIEQFAIPPEPFLDLLVAFRRDQSQTAYRDRDELLEYCRHSANPVGHLVLYLGECYSEPNARLSDSICTGLQIANFCQDVAEDYRRGRIYLPGDRCRAYGYDEAMFSQGLFNDAFRRLLRDQVDWADQLLADGQELIPRLPRDLRVDVELIRRGGQAILQAIRDQDYNVWASRPRVSKGKQARLLWTAWWQAGRNSAPSMP